jgi:hypothetical protein
MAWVSFYYEGRDWNISQELHQTEADIHETADIISSKKCYARFNKKQKNVHILSKNLVQTRYLCRVRTK